MKPPFNICFPQKLSMTAIITEGMWTFQEFIYNWPDNEQRQPLVIVVFNKSSADYYEKLGKLSFDCLAIMSSHKDEVFFYTY